MIRTVKIPELPPGYDLRYDRKCKDWNVYIRGNYCDGIDEPLRTRAAAEKWCWWHWESYGADGDWQDFIDELRELANSDSELLIVE